MGIITEDTIKSYLRKEGYDIDLIKSYLEYRKNKNLDNKLSVEECVISDSKNDMNDKRFLDWFATYMGWGYASDIPDTHSFLVYCTKRDLYTYPSKKNYIVGDSEYIAPGYVAFRNDDNQFFKIYTSNILGFNNYHLVARDVNVDEPGQEFRDIVFQAGENDPLYVPLKELHNLIGETHITTIDPRVQGKNYFFVEKSKSGYNLIIAKDVYGVEKATDFINIYIGDNCSCREWATIDTMNRNLGLAEDINFQGQVVKKIMGIRPKQI
jgi:hypothetical protein